MQHASILLLAVAAASVACGSKPTYEEVIRDFKEESGADFVDCGTEPVMCSAEGVSHPSEDFLTTADCLVAAWAECRPASAVLLWHFRLTEEAVSRSVFVVPDGQDCHLVVFESTGTDNLDRLECADLLTTGECGVLEPTECEWQSSATLAPQRG